MKKLLLVLLACFFGALPLAGCDGNGSPDTTGSAGLWEGTFTDSANNTSDMAGVMSTNGRLRFIILSGECEGTQYGGRFSLHENTGSGRVTGFAAEGCTFENGETTVEATFDFTIAGNSLTGTAFTGQDETGTFDLTYDPAAETPITFTDLEGDWGADQGGDDALAITVSSDGSFTGTGFCDYTGRASIIDPDWSIINISVTASNCQDPSLDGAYTGLGLLVLDDSGDELYFMVSSDSASFFDILERL